MSIIAGATAFCRSAGTRTTAHPCTSHIAGYFVRVDFILRVAGMPVPSRGTRDSDLQAMRRLLYLAWLYAVLASQKYSSSNYC
jgi:hypothetical protein